MNFTLESVGERTAEADLGYSCRSLLVIEMETEIEWPSGSVCAQVILCAFLKLEAIN